MKNQEKVNSFTNKLLNYFSENQILTDEVECWPYGYDYSGNHCKPDLVIFPVTQEQVQHAVVLCNKFKIPIIARGKATGATGGCVPVLNGIVMSFEKMNKILKIDIENKIAIVQPGVINLELQNILSEYGFMFGPLPTSAAYSSIGGNLACNASGSRSLKYGSCRDNTLGLKFVTGGGELIKTGSNTSKHAVGYDLTRLMVGQEGTLGIITEAILKIIPKPKKIITVYGFFNDTKAACKTVIDIMASTINPYSLEFIDKVCLDSIRNINNIPTNAKSLLISELEINRVCDSELIDILKSYFTNNDVILCNLDEDGYENSFIWKIRKELSASLKKIAPKKINEDIVIPISHLSEFLQGVYIIGEKFDIKTANFGHAGNGNIHVNLLIDPNNDDEVSRAKSCLLEIFKLSIEHNGALSGEHGIGIEKKNYIELEINQPTISLMKQIKSIFDPNLVLNPCKILA